MTGRTIFVSVAADEGSVAILNRCIEPLAVDGLRVDSWISEASPGHFSSVIGRRIAACSAFVAIFNGSSRNIAYETGKAVGLGKPILLVARSLADVPSMLTDTDVVVTGEGPTDYERVTVAIDHRLDVLLCGQFADERVRAHVAQLRRKPYTPNARPSARPSRENDTLARAIRCYQSGNYLDAAKLLERGIESSEIDTGRAPAYFYLADSYFLQAEGLPEGEDQVTLFQQMLRIADKGHHLYPNDERLHKTLGLAHLKCRNLERAKEVFRGLTKEHPGYPLGHYNMACVHAQCNELFKCIETLHTLFAQARHNESWRYLARLDPDFDPIWEECLLQRLLYPPAH